MSTNTPVTQGRLDEIQARVDAVGPVLPARHGTAPYEVYDSTGHESGKMGGYMTHGSPREVDAEFITHAYTDVPALLAEVQRLRVLTTVTEDMVERAARALSAHWRDMTTNGSLDRERHLAAVALETIFGANEGS